MPSECLFCKVWNGEVPSRAVLKEGEVYAFEDVRPVAPVHVLIVPRRHIPSVGDLGPQDAPVWFQMLDVARRAAAGRSLRSDGYRLAGCCGPQARPSADQLALALPRRRASRPPR